MNVPAGHEEETSQAHGIYFVYNKVHCDSLMGLCFSAAGGGDAYGICF